MRIFITVAICILGGVVLAQALNVGIKSTESFSDGTQLEAVNLKTPNAGQPPIVVVQIKQTDGTVCYAIAGQGGTSNVLNVAAPSCVK